MKGWVSSFRILTCRFRDFHPACWASSAYQQGSSWSLRGRLGAGCSRAPLAIKTGQQERRARESKVSLVCGDGGCEKRKTPCVEEFQEVTSSRCNVGRT